MRKEPIADPSTPVRLRIGDAVLAPGSFLNEISQGTVGLIIDFNPEYWFVQWPCGSMLAYRSTDLKRIDSM